MSKHISIIQDSTGMVQAHSADCRDLTRKARKDPLSDVFSMGHFNTTREVWLEYNADFLEEGGSEAAWDIDFLPCCGLEVDDDRSY